MQEQRIGHRMQEVLYWVAKHPGETQNVIAGLAGPNGSHRFGTQAVKRCLRAGLIENRSTNGWSKLYIVE